MDEVKNDRTVHSKKIIPLVKFLLPTLTNSERKAAEYILDYPQEVVDLTLVDYGRSIGEQPSISYPTM